ncbi:MAG: hypothetical protein JWQ98_3119 [Chlorobi bacterium]|nr:hypothetical protein [Chlorobiota bacterium]
MDEPTNFTPSDLLYLFLDGEANGMQQAILFGALAGDGELQAEFTQALHMRSALESERNDLRPPVALTNDLFAKAGFGAPVAESVAPALSTAGGDVLGRLGIPFLCAVAGALITAILFGSIYGREIDALKREMAIATRASTLPHGNEARASRKPITTRDAHTDGNVANAGGADMTARTIAAPVHAGRGGTGGYSPVDSRETTRAARSAPIPAIAPREPATSAAAGTTIVSSTTARSLPIELHRNAGAATIASIAPIPPLSDPLLMRRDDADISAYPYSARLRGITDLRFYPDRDLNGALQPWYGNASIGGEYHLTENHAVGIEIGEDRMPMYRSSGTGFVRDDRLFWGGATYQFRMNRIEVMGGVQPFFEGMAGATMMGPIGKGTVGISYAPEGRISMGIGIEGTALLYQLRGQWYSTQKTGVAYLVNVHF